jgi:hypothetical protein
MCYRNFQKWHIICPHISKDFITLTVNPYESYAQYSVSKWTARLMISYTVYNSAIPWNILIYCPLDSANLLFNRYITAVSMEHSFIYNSADTTMYNDPLLSNSQTSQTVTVQQSTAISNNNNKIHKNNKVFILQAKKIRGSRTIKFFKITIP